MTVLWSYFWPVAALGLVAGAFLGTLALRKQRNWLIGLGLLVTLAGAALWHGPLGAAERLAAKVDSTAEFVLADWEMSQVDGRLHRQPLTRRLMLSGPADDFQRGELVRIMSTIPGVSRATWSDDGGLPLLAEAAGVCVAGFLLGLLLAYLVELRRRHNAQWKW
jgi:hypothetical protein